jgi:hypothetical protein
LPGGAAKSRSSCALWNCRSLRCATPLQVCPDPSSEATMEQRLGVPIGERTDHPAYIRDALMNVKRTYQAPRNGVTQGVASRYLLSFRSANREPI